MTNEGYISSECVGVGCVLMVTSQTTKVIEDHNTDTPSKASWLAWPELSSPDQERLELLPDYRKILRRIVTTYGEAKLTQSFRDVCNVLNKRRVITTSDIPVVDYQNLSSLGTQDLDEIRGKGCFVIRNVVERSQVEHLFNELKEYISANASQISGWPADNPCIKSLYWSKAQVLLRGHPSHLHLQKWINGLWELEGNTEYVEPITYADAIRLRPPKTKMTGLGPHIDAGSLSRWGDCKYREFYRRVFEGDASQLDMYDLGLRKEAGQDLYPGPAHSSFFRTFQGWTALSSVGHKKGGLFLRPYPKETISYVLLRPFFKPLKKQDEEGFLEPDNWVLDIDNAYFPGTFPEQSQMVSPIAHPHLNLEKTFVSIPEMSAGDTVWWHCDMIHAVDVDHEGEDYASVAYIAASPSTEKNVKYASAQSDAFKAGTAPADHQSPHSINESKLQGYVDGNSLLTDSVSRKALLI